MPPDGASKCTQDRSSVSGSQLVLCQFRRQMLRWAHRLGLCFGQGEGENLRVGNMLVSDHLRPAAIKAGLLRVAEDSRVYDSSGSPVKRLGFHNLRHSLSTALMTGEKEDPRTVQDMLRHSKVATSQELYRARCNSGSRRRRNICAEFSRRSSW
jgi:integrase